MKIDAYDVSIQVKGRFDADEQFVAYTLAGHEFLAMGFELIFTPAGNGWQTRNVTVTGYRAKPSGAPGRAAGKITYWLSEESTPRQVHEIVECVRPVQGPPRIALKEK